MLETCLCIAFGTIEADIQTMPWTFGIDRIYPKSHYSNGKRFVCSLSEIKRLCDLWLTTPVSSFEQVNASATASNALKIETMFERIRNREIGQCQIYQRVQNVPSRKQNRPVLPYWTFFKIKRWIAK